MHPEAEGWEALRVLAGTPCRRCYDTGWITYTLKSSGKVRQVPCVCAHGQEWRDLAAQHTRKV